jgi:hypothetical protein
MPTSRLPWALRATTSPRASSSRDSSTSSEVDAERNEPQESSSSSRTVFSAVSPLSRRLRKSSRVAAVVNENSGSRTSGVMLMA